MTTHMYSNPNLLVHPVCDAEYFVSFMKMKVKMSDDTKFEFCLGDYYKPDVFYRVFIDTVQFLFEDKRIQKFFANCESIKICDRYHAMVAVELL